MKRESAKQQSTNAVVDKINALLPQTQCTDCGFQGCLPYAKAIADGEIINKCLPGGISTLENLGALLNKDITLLKPELIEKQKPKRLAIIREDECIGCTKCIQACPIDAIMGTAKLMHSVINSECTGCGLCVEPCPVDCIDLPTLDNQSYDPPHAKMRYENRLKRLEKTSLQEKLKHEAAKNLTSIDVKAPQTNKKAAILAAIARSKANKGK